MRYWLEQIQSYILLVYTVIKIYQMKEYAVEFDVSLWSYALHYKDQKYSLDTLNIMRANELAELKLLYLKRQEANESQATNS